LNNFGIKVINLNSTFAANSDNEEGINATSLPSGRTGLPRLVLI